MVVQVADFPQALAETVDANKICCPRRKIMSVTRKNLKKSEEILFLVSSLIFCLIIAFGQPVNPFPVDNWFKTQYQLIGQFTGQDN